MSRARSGISIGTIAFWGVLGWFWFGDTLKDFVSKKVEVTVKEDTIKIDASDFVEKVKAKVNDIKNQIEEVDNKKKQKEENPNPDEERIMTAEEDSRYKSNDLYGNQDDKW